MKTKIGAILLAGAMLTSCGDDFMDRMNVNTYVPDGYFTTKDRANQALTAAYAQLNAFTSWGRHTTGMNLALGDDFYMTPNGTGWDGYGQTGLFLISNTDFKVTEVWGGFYNGVARANVALEALATAKESDATLTDEQYNSMRGQALVLRAFNYYHLYTWFPKDRLILYEEVPLDPSPKAPATAEAIFALIESDLKEAQTLLVNSLKGTSGYAPERVTRGTAAAILGKLYMAEHEYAKASTEFAKILPGSDGTYGTYSLVDYRKNFTLADKNNAESILEFQFGDTGNGGNNIMDWVMNSFTMNRSGGAGHFWWNFAFPSFQIDHFESWDEGGTTVYDYRLYATMWGVPNGATYTTTEAVTWDQQGWADQDIVAGYTGSYGMRKFSSDSNAERYSTDNTRGIINHRHIRLADIMLLYAECMANLNASNTSAADKNSAVYWVQQIRNRANQPMTDQTHLYSARPGTPGQLPSAADLMASKGWSTLDLVKHERRVEGFGEGWRREDLVRWQVGENYDPLLKQFKSGWKGYQTLILPVPQVEINNNPFLK